MVFRKIKKQPILATFTIVMDHYSKQNPEITVGQALTQFVSEYYTDVVYDCLYSGREFDIAESLRLSKTNCEVDSLLDKINKMPQDFKEMKANYYIQLLKSISC